MAEARSVASLEEITRGTRVSLAVDELGLHLRTEVIIPPLREALHRTVRTLRRWWRSIERTFFPIAMPILLLVVTLVVAVVLGSPPSSWVRNGRVAHLVWTVGGVFPWLPWVTLSMRIGILAAWATLVAMLLVAHAERLLLRLLLSDKAYLYQARNPSLQVKLWFRAVSWLTARRGALPHSTYVFQRALPRLPVPDLRATVEGYLASAQLVQGPEEFAATEAMARAFLGNEGPRLQRYLHLKAWLAPNYVSDWWERYVYLRGRSPIAIGSNYYVLDSKEWLPTTSPESRAAVLIHALCRYAARLEDEEVEPVMIADGVVPLDMEQSRRLFGTVRLPGQESDELVHYAGRNPAACRHVVVGVRGRYYMLPVYRADGTLRAPDDLEDALLAIKRDAASGALSSPAEGIISVLTSLDRTRWAEVRAAHFSEGPNRRSLHAIDTALFCVTLAEDATGDWAVRGKRLLAGDRARPDVWYDKSINLIVAADGRAGMNCEHSYADAPAIGHMWETSLLLYEHVLAPYAPDGSVRRLGSDPSVWDDRLAGVGVSERACRRARRAPSAGSKAMEAAATALTQAAHVAAAAGELCRRGAPLPGADVAAAPAAAAAAAAASPAAGALGTPCSASEPLGSPGVLTATTKAPPALAGPVAPASASASASTSVGSPGWARLTWSLSRAAEACIDGALADHQAAWDDLQLNIGSFTSFGKSWPKRCRVSPDAFIQAALQLAYFRDQGRFDMTYESSMTRLFLHGRTETVRPLTQEMIAFVRTMEDAGATPREKLRALQAAAARHVLGYTDAMAGKGIDRHLFALLIVSIGKGIEAPFLKAALSVPWKLSTSQQPQQQTHYWDARDPAYADKICPGGGFGPVVKDGYGVSYMVSGEHEMFFHVSSHVSAANTDSARFLRHIFDALTGMKTAMQPAVEAEEAAKAAKAAAARAAVTSHHAEQPPPITSAAAASGASVPPAAAESAHVQGISGYMLGMPALGPLASPAVVPTPMPDDGAGAAGESARTTGNSQSAGEPVDRLAPVQEEAACEQ